ncbi:taste receptor type 2 member 4 [Echinops telfairi]|uniref:Taste receptor type 2 n=1 Tax=Echinops telfairi TaxID=9371 RepID=A0ABM0J3M2_ECHTE|nr:taste receptor type 2 member 4 [Echinops telfairi]
MQPVFFFCVLVASVALNFVGFLMSLFIAVVSFKTWTTKHSRSPSDRILFSLAVSRLLMLGLLLLNMGFIFSAADQDRSVSLSTFFLLSWMFLDTSGLWFVTLLNTLYCVKITNLQHAAFLLLKRHLAAKTSRLLLASVLTPTLTTLLFFMINWTSSISELGPKRNQSTFGFSRSAVVLVMSSFLSSFPQFILNVTSASLLINSLQRHIQKMRRNATGFWNPQTEATVGAMKLMIYFLILYVPYSFATILSYLPHSVGMGVATRAVCIIVSTVYSPGHSLLLILTHPRLKTKAKHVLSCSR